MRGIREVLRHEHDWDSGAGWTLYIDKTMPVEAQTGWRRECARCGAWQWRARLDWQKP